jgi:uncharacterized membrane protein YccC
MSRLPSITPPDKTLVSDGRRIGSWSSARRPLTSRIIAADRRRIRSPAMRITDWVAAKDPDYLALRRAVRAAIVAPICLALTVEVIGDAAMATFAVFAAIGLLILVDIPGPMRQRLANYAALAGAGAVLVCLATPLSGNVWLATISMALVGFAIVFVGVLSSVLAASTTALLLAWILPVSTQAPAADIPARVSGWGLGSALAILALALIWPPKANDPLREQAGETCRRTAIRLRGQATAAMDRSSAQARAEDPELAAAADAAMSKLKRTFRRTPYRPTTLSTGGRAMVRMIDELDWVSVVANQYGSAVKQAPAVADVAAVWDAAADVLDRCADILGLPSDANSQAARAALDAALERLEAAMHVVRHSATIRSQLVFTSCEPSFRGQELSYAVRQVGRNVALMAAADARSFVDRLLGRTPDMQSSLGVARFRARSHFDVRSVWLHNSLRSAAALAVAVFVATTLGVQHSFWVVLGVLSVLRSTALNTGQNAVRGLVGTVVGFVVGGAILIGIGTNTVVLWVLLPIAVLAAGFAPAAISFLAGQAAFTVVVVMLFNIIHPAGWRVGLIRVEDVAIGCLVSLVVGLVFWPRGAATALGVALSAAYRSSSHYLSRAIDANLTGRGGAATAEKAAALADFGRLDDAFRQFLAERGAKHVPLAEASSLVTGTVALRLSADAVVDLWHDVDGAKNLANADRAVVASAEQIERWYDSLAESLSLDGQLPPDPISGKQIGEDRWAAALAADTVPGTEMAAVRVIWTADHLDAARRQQPKLVEAARMAAKSRGAWLT